MVESFARTLRAYAEKDGRGYSDWAMRYAPIVRRLRARMPDSALILEIGANAAGLAAFTSSPVFVIDTSTGNLREAAMRPNVIAIRADARALPFRDQAMDVCVCVDAIEHFPPATRTAAVHEIVRVLDTRGAAVIAFPSGARAARAERRIRDEYMEQTGRRLPWLEEHKAAGLPDADDITRCCIETAGPAHRVARTKNTRLRLWIWTWRVLMCGWPGRGNALAQAFLRWATPLFCRVHFGTCYRTVIWIEPRFRI